MSCLLVFLSSIKQSLCQQSVCSVFYKKQCTYNPQMQTYTGPLRTNKVKNGKLGKLTDEEYEIIKSHTSQGY